MLDEAEIAAKRGLPFVNKKSNKHTIYFRKEDWLNINTHTVKKNNCEPSTTKFGGKITGKITNVQNLFRNIGRKTSRQNKSLPSFYCVYLSFLSIPILYITLPFLNYLALKKKTRLK